MNTATTPLRLTAAASVVALAVTLAGCAVPATASAADEPGPVASAETVVSPVMHDLLGARGGRAIRYVN